MTTQAAVPESLPRDDPPSDESAWMLGLALRLLVHGLAVLGAAVMLGVAQALELWMGALMVAVLLMLLAAGAALVGLVGRLRPHRSTTTLHPARGRAGADV